MREFKLISCFASLHIHDMKADFIQTAEPGKRVWIGIRLHWPGIFGGIARRVCGRQNHIAIIGSKQTKVTTKIFNAKAE